MFHSSNSSTTNQSSYCYKWKFNSFDHRPCSAKNIHVSNTSVDTWPNRTAGKVSNSCTSATENIRTCPYSSISCWSEQAGTTKINCSHSCKVWLIPCSVGRSVAHRKAVWTECTRKQCTMFLMYKGGDAVKKSTQQRSKVIQLWIQ